MTPTSDPRPGEADLARLGVRLRAAQKAHSDRRRKHKPAECLSERIAEAAAAALFDAACARVSDSRLARLGIAMRDAQRRHAELLRKLPESQCSNARAQAYALQAKFETLCREVLEAEQPVLPGLEGGDT